MNNIKYLRKAKNKTQQQMADYLGITQQGYACYENGTRMPPIDMIIKLAEYFNVSIDYLLARSNYPNDLQKNFEQVYIFPVIGTISAGYNGNAEESYTGEDLIVPQHLIKTHNQNDYFVLEVKGDSMVPIFQPGDKVLILRCDIVDSGTIAAVGFNDEQATVKKVEYIKGEDWMRLVPRNPDYPVITIKGSDLELCRVYGEVVYLFRDKIGF